MQYHHEQFITRLFSISLHFFLNYVKCNFVFSGLAGYLGGVAVAVKQAMPDYVIYRTPMGKITNSNVPLGCFIFTFIMWMIGLVECECIMFASGIIISAPVMATTMPPNFSKIV